MACRKFPIDPITPPPPPPPPPPTPEPGPDPGPTPGPSGFFYAASYYGILTSGGNDGIFLPDLDKLKSLRISNIRIWFDWAGIKWSPPGGTIVNPDGSLISGMVDRLRRVIGYAADRGIRVDLTSGGKECAYNSFDAWLTALRNVATVFKDITTFYPVDVQNEVTASFGKQGQTIARVIQATQLVKSIAPNWPVTASMDGDVGMIGNNYKQLIAGGAKIDVLAPHYRRDEGWGDKVSQRTTQLRADLAAVGISRPIYVQEENRDGEPYWSVEQSTRAAAGAKASGATGYCFHTIAGFDVRSSGYFAHLSSNELAAMQQLP